MTDKNLIEWAIKGLSAEIDKLEKNVHQGYRLLNDLQNGKPIKSPLNADEIQFVINQKKEEIEKLYNEILDLRWRLTE
jgi:hypothetical protein